MEPFLQCMPFLTSIQRYRHRCPNSVACPRVSTLTRNAQPSRPRNVSLHAGEISAGTNGRTLGVYEVSGSVPHWYALLWSPVALRSGGVARGLFQCGLDARSPHAQVTLRSPHHRGGCSFCLAFSTSVTDFPINYVRVNLTGSLCA